MGSSEHLILRQSVIFFSFSLFLPGPVLRKPSLSGPSQKKSFKEVVQAMFFAAVKRALAVQEVTEEVRVGVGFMTFYLQLASQWFI